MTNKIALVTGANKSIGLEVTRALACLGMTVYLTSRDVEGGRTAAETSRSHGDIRYLPVEVTDEATMTSALDAIDQAHGRLDVLVNNAGIVQGGGDALKALPIARPLAGLLTIGTVFAMAIAPISTAESGPIPAGFVSPLATSEQAAAERLALGVVADPQVRAARLVARAEMEAAAPALTPEGHDRLDHVLDTWIALLALTEASSDATRPVIVWTCNNAAYSWFGHKFPGSGAAIDNPDNVYRGLALDSASRYLIKGQLRPMHPAQFSFQLIRRASMVPTGSDLVSLGVLTSSDLDIDANGAFTITIDADPAAGRRNHLQSQPGAPLQVIIRDTLTNWRQNPNVLKVERVGGPPAGPPIDEHGAAQKVAEALPGFVGGWLHFIAAYMGAPKDNIAPPPLARTGGWGYMAPLRFNLADDEALVVTLDDAASEYAAVQVTDVWMIAPDPQDHLASYTTAQSRRNADGTYTYVLSREDPGVANWIDTAGWRRGWLQLRWQGVPATRTSGDGLIREVKLVKRSELASILPPAAVGITPEQRRAMLTERAEEWRLRIATGPAR